VGGLEETQVCDPIVGFGFKLPQPTTRKSVTYCTVRRKIKGKVICSFYGIALFGICYFLEVDNKNKLLRNS
jgi:hypothetical protein